MPTIPTISTSADTPGTSLSTRERAVLAFERDWHLHGGHKQRAIAEHFGFAPTYYYQLLARLLERPEAEAADPLLIRRLRRQRERRQTRAGGRLNEQVRGTGHAPASK